MSHHYRPPAAFLRIYASDITSDGTVSSEAISRECKIQGVDSSNVSVTLVSELRKYARGYGCVSIVAESEIQLYVQYLPWGGGGPVPISHPGWANLVPKKSYSLS
jgi:hypothetical protein